jgi:serine protease Do
MHVWSRLQRNKGLAVVAGLAFVLGGLAVARAARPGVTNPPATLKMASPAAMDTSGFTKVVQQVLPTVVNISSSKVVRTPAGFESPFPMDPFFRQFFGDQFNSRNLVPRDRREQSLGSGVVVSPEGYILTNHHVVDGATDIRVTMSDKREYKARLIGSDKRTDIALLKIDGGPFKPITIGDSSKVEVGEFALAIGDPFGVGQTVTMGIVSAKGRSNLGIEDYEDFIQTDAPINPGNSGGALIDEHGDLIGINTAILSHGDGGNEGIGFAIPVNLARHVMDQLLKDGKVVRAWLGIVPQDVTPTIAKAFHVTSPEGALVGDVTPSSPASRAGLVKGDIITELNGKTVEDSNQLRIAISTMSPGTEVRLKVLRDGQPHDLTAKLEEYPSDKQIAENHQKAEQSDQLDGVSVDNLSPDSARELGLPVNTQGVVVTDIDPGSRAAEAGLRSGDVIQEVNRQKVHNTSELQNALNKAGEDPLLLVNRGGTTLYVAV